MADVQAEDPANVSDVKIEEVVSVEEDNGDKSKMNRDVFADATLAEMAKTRNLMRIISSLSVGMGSILLLAMFIICLTSWGLNAESVTLCFVVGLFALLSGVAIDHVYKFGGARSVVRSVVRSVRVAGPGCGGLRLRTNREIADARPRTFLTASAVVLIACSACMVVGDVRINNEFGFVPAWTVGSRLVHAAFSSAFFTCAFVNLALVFLRTDRLNRSAAFVGFLFNLVGMGMALALILVNTPYTVRLDNMVKHFVSLPLAKAAMYQKVPLPITNWILLKFFPVDILMAFCAANLMTIVGLLFTTRGKDELKKTEGKTKSSVSIGIIGVVLVVAGIALEIVLTYLPMIIKVDSNYQLDNVHVAKIFAVLMFLLTGLQSCFGFYFAQTARRFTLFFLSVGLFSWCTWALINVNDIQQDVARVERNALVPGCMGQQHDSDLFCVFNVTKNTFRRPVIDWTVDPANRVCIPREKYCDGTVDIVDDGERRARQSSYYGGRRFLFVCSPSAYDFEYDYFSEDESRASFPDEEFCYSNGPAYVLFMTAMAVFGLGMLCSVLLFLLTASSLPKAFLAAGRAISGAVVVPTQVNEAEVTKDEKAPSKT